MNLRDLIYSQNTDDSSHNYEFENLGNFEKEQFDDLIDSTLHPDSKAYSSKKDYSKRFLLFSIISLLLIIIYLFIIDFIATMGTCHRSKNQRGLRFFPNLLR